MSKVLIERKLEEAQEALAAAKRIADETGESFTFSVGYAFNADRNIAGDYYPAGTRVERYEVEGRRGEWDDTDHLYNKDAPWVGCMKSCTKEECGDSCGTGVLAEGMWSAWQSSSETC